MMPALDGSTDWRTRAGSVLRLAPTLRLRSRRIVIMMAEKSHRPSREAIAMAWLHLKFLSQ